MDRRVPPVPTYRETLDNTFALVREAGQSEARAKQFLGIAWQRAHAVGLEPIDRDHPDADRRHFAGKVSDMQMQAATEVVKAIGEFQKWHAEKVHWERVYRGYADKLDANPELADKPLRVPGWMQRIAKRSE